MSEVLALGSAAFVIALTGAMAPGPLLTVTITETVRRGRLAASMLLVGHALLEAALIVGFIFGLESFLDNGVVSSVLGVAGGGFLVWMGGTLLADAVRGRLALDLESQEEAPRLGPVFAGAAVSLSNPYWALWWLTIGVKLATDGIAIGPAGVAAFFIGHEAADVLWYGIVIAAVHSGRRFLNDTVYRWIIGVCAAFLVLLGGQFVLSAVTGGM
ncbi:MAG: LysE family transporter [Coriobacteriia bacterium]